MRPFTYFITVVLLSVLSRHASGQSYIRKFPDRYELDLPKEWNKPKLFKAVTEVLPRVFEELNNMDFCTDCQSAYKIMLVVDTPYIVSRNNISNGYTSNNQFRYTMEVIYKFRAALAIFDKSGKNITELVLVSPQEQHKIQRETQMRGMSYTESTIKDKYGKPTVIRIPVNNPPPISNNLWPTLYNLVDIAEQRVYEIRDILAKLK
jgi:hypothetical protein